jgi:hypothetical protein
MVPPKLRNSRVVSTEISVSTVRTELFYTQLRPIPGRLLTRGHLFAELRGDALGHQSQGAVAGSASHSQARLKVLLGLLFLGGVSTRLHILVQERGVELPKRLGVGGLNRFLIISHTGSISRSLQVSAPQS